MRFTSAILCFTLVLSATSAPAGDGLLVIPRAAKDEDIGDGFPFWTANSFKKGNTEKTKLLCDQFESDVRGEGTGMKSKEIWQKTNMDYVLAHFDNFLEGFPAPFGPFVKSLPTTLGDLTSQYGDIFGGFHCTREQCDEPKFNTVAQCEKSELAAQLWKVNQALYYFQGYMASVRNFVASQGSLIANQIGALLTKLDPIELSSFNAGWAIYISSILGGIAAFLGKNPVAQAVAGLGGALFGMATATITQLGNLNDQKIIDHFYNVEELKKRTVKTYASIGDNMKEFASKILDDKPINTLSEPYSKSENNAITVLKGGTFAQSVDPDDIDTLEENMYQSSFMGLVAGMWTKLFIGKLTKKILDTAPCDLKAGEQYPNEFWRLCVGDIAYFFANASFAPEGPDQGFPNLVKQFKTFVEDEDRSTYAGIKPVDMVDDSSSSEKKFGWNRSWDGSEELMRGLLENLQDPDHGRLSPFNYPILELDWADGDFPYYYRTTGAEISWTNNRHQDKDRLRFMMMQCIREQTDSHGNKFPWPTAKNYVWRRYPYRWRGELRKE